jgi:hypothetical protein
MTVATLLNRVSYAGNGVTTVFSFPNRFLADADIVVALVVDATSVVTPQVLTTHYTLTGAGEAAGGDATMLVAPPTGTTLVIYRDPALTQPIDLVNGDPLNVETGVERAFDRSTLQIQRLRDIFDGTIRLPDVETGPMVLPAVTQRANTILGFDSLGNPFAAVGGAAPVTAVMATVLDDATAGAAIETLRAALVAKTSLAPDDEILLRDTAAATGKRAALRDFVRYEAVRQTVVRGAIDTNGASAFLSAGTGLAVNLAATATPLIATFAAGEDALGPINYRAVISADAADYWADLPGDVISFLFLDRDATTGAITPHATTMRPKWGRVFDARDISQLNFLGANGSTVFTDQYGGLWAAVGNAQINNNKLLCDGTGDGIENLALPLMLDGSNTVEADVVFNVLPTAGNSATVVSAFNAGGFGLLLTLTNTAGTLRATVSASSNGSSNDIAAASGGTKTSWATATKYHFSVVRDKLNNALNIFVDGVLDISVFMLSSANICAFGTVRLGLHAAAASPLAGTIDNFRVSPCARYPNGVTFTPPAAGFTPDAEWFDTTEHRFKYGSPTSWEYKQRLCVGECSTVTGSVFTTSEYALKGTFVSSLTTIPASGTQQSFSHKLGVSDAYSLTLKIVCQVAEKGYSIGDTVYLHTAGDAATGAIAIAGIGRVSATCTFLTGIPIVNRGAATFSNITPASWKYELTAVRR